MAAGKKAPRAEPAKRAPVQVGTQVDVLKVLFGRPEFGFLFLIVAVAESALFAFIMRASSETEREIGIGVFAVLLLATLLVFYMALPRLLPAQIVPESLVAAAIPPQEAERRPDLVYAPDATFGFHEPPENWTYELTTLAEDVGNMLGSQGLGDGDAFPSELLPFRAGRMVVFSERTPYALGYLPGRSTINGRPALGALDEIVREQIRMFSISKNGSVMRQVTAEQVFAQTIGNITSGGLSIVDIAQASFGTEGRSMLTTRAVSRFDEVTVDGSAPQSVELELRLHVVERSSFIYVIQATHLLNTKRAEARGKEIDAIIAAFQPVSPANAEQRALQDKQEADETWQRMMESVAPKILATKALTLVDQMKRPDGEPEVSDRQLGNLRMLASYAAAFPDLVPTALLTELEEVRDAAAQARQGRPEALQRKIAEMIPTPAAAPLPEIGVAQA